MRISLRASSPIWASEVSLARLASLAQIGELARRLNADQFRIQKRNCVFLGKSKNTSWIHKIHTQGGFFGSNPNPDFWDSKSERFLGEGFEKSIFGKRFFEQKWYATDAVHVWRSNWIYVDGVLSLSHISCIKFHVFHRFTLFVDFL